MLPYGRKNPLPFLYSLSSPITTVLSKGKGEIYKRVENRRLSTLLCARAASAQFRSPRRRNHLKKENLKKIRNFEKKHLRDTPGVVYTNYSCANA